MQGFCPNCNIDLSVDNNTVKTKESKIFKGHNVYCMCKNCGYVMVYNQDRNLIFSLDRFKDDPEILEEIHQLLSEAGNAEIEVVSKDEPECNNDCSSCTGCSPENTEVVKQGDLLIVEKETGAMSIIHQDSLERIDIDKYEFFELNPVIVERIVSYKICHV